MTRFYYVDSQEHGVTADWDPEIALDPCPVCGYNRTPNPEQHYVVQVEDPGHVLDLMSVAPVYVCTPRFRSWYRNSGSSGLDFAPLPNTDLQRVVITGDARLHDASGVKLEEECSECGRQSYSVAGAWRVDETAWDGSSFLHVRERPATLLCTSDAKTAVEESGLTGPTFMPVEELFI